MRIAFSHERVVMLRKLLATIAVIGMTMPAADTMARGGGHHGAFGHSSFGHGFSHFEHHHGHDGHGDHHDHGHHFADDHFGHWPGHHFSHGQPGRWNFASGFGGHDHHGHDNGVWHR
jgi:hypothetical protein